MDLEKIFKMLVSKFQEQNIDFALIGGLALHFAGYSRSTTDIDMVVLFKDQPAVERVMQDLGYSCLYKTENVANYQHSSPIFAGVDFLFAHRKYSLAMLQRAHRHSFCGFDVKVLSPEDLIGLKVQSFCNDPSRENRDLSDIEELLRANKDKLDLVRVREYFDLFKRTNILMGLLEKINGVE